MPRRSQPIAPVPPATDAGGRALQTLVLHNVHPLKIAMIEALLWIEEPLSPSDVARFVKIDADNGTLSLVAYHARQLAKLDVLELVETRQVRGATQHLYFFPQDG